MKKLLILALLVILALLLVSCECNHTDVVKTEHPVSCGVTGYTHYKCNICGLEFDADYVPPTPHTFKETVVEPTCETEGYTLKECTACDYVEKSDFKRSLGHDIKETKYEAACEKQGYIYAECNRCDYTTAYEFVDPTGHEYKKTVTTATLERVGYTTYSCMKCDRKYKSDFTYYNDLFTGAAGEGKGALAKGIDVSFYNENIDWQAVKASGVEFAIIRLGTTYKKDDMFESHYAGAKSVGLDVGVYFFTYSEDVLGAKKDAELTLKYLNGKKLEYPVFYDMEDYEKGGYVPSELAVDVRTDMYYTYITTMIENKYYPGVYTNINWIENKFSEKQVCTLFDVWIARYPSDYKLYEKEYSGKFSMWQYTDSGTVAGIAGGVDMNLAFKDYPALMKEYGFNGY